MSGYRRSTSRVGKSRRGSRQSSCPPPSPTSESQCCSSAVPGAPSAVASTSRLWRHIDHLVSSSHVEGGRRDKSSPEEERRSAAVSRRGGRERRRRGGGGSSSSSSGRERYTVHVVVRGGCSGTTAAGGVAVAVATAIVHAAAEEAAPKENIDGEKRDVGDRFGVLAPLGHSNPISFPYCSGLALNTHNHITLFKEEFSITSHSRGVLVFHEFMLDDFISHKDDTITQLIKHRSCTSNYPPQ